jgi:hypothetical protein
MHHYYYWHDDNMYSWSTRQRTKVPRDEQIEYRTGDHNNHHHIAVVVVVAAAVHGFVGILIISMWWWWMDLKNASPFLHLINRIVVLYDVCVLYP